MLKNLYSLKQVGICSPSGNFQISQALPDVTQASSIGNPDHKHVFPGEIRSGQFKEEKSCGILNCCSCRSTKELTLTMYGQIISKAYIDSCCNLFPCIISQQLIVTTLSEVLIGKVTKQSCFSSDLLVISDSSDNNKFTIRRAQFSCIACLPRTLRCGSVINYQIIDMKDQKVGQIHNSINGCFQALFTCLDQYQIDFQKVTSDKDKILLLNALVYLDVIKHEFF